MITIINLKNDYKKTKLIHNFSNFEYVAFKIASKKTEYVLWGPTGCIYKAELDEKNQTIELIFTNCRRKYPRYELTFQFVEILR